MVTGGDTSVSEVTGTPAEASAAARAEALEPPPAMVPIEAARDLAVAEDGVATTKATSAEGSPSGSRTRLRAPVPVDAAAAAGGGGGGPAAVLAALASVTLAIVMSAGATSRAAATVVMNAACMLGAALKLAAETPPSPSVAATWLVVKEPEGLTRQAAEPALGAYVPGAHSSQRPLVVLANWPTGQSEQDVALAPETEPGAHAVQDDALSPLKEPACARRRGR